MLRGVSVDRVGSIEQESDNDDIVDDDEDMQDLMSAYKNLLSTETANDAEEPLDTSVVEQSLPTITEHDELLENTGMLKSSASDILTNSSCRSDTREASCDAQNDNDASRELSGKIRTGTLDTMGTDDLLKPMGNSLGDDKGGSLGFSGEGK